MKALNKNIIIMIIAVVINDVSWMQHDVGKLKVPPMFLKYLRLSQIERSYTNENNVTSYKHYILLSKQLI